MINKIRERVPATTRGKVYSVANAVIAALVVFGVLSSSLAPAVVGVAISVITLIYAILHSVSEWRSALYATLGAIGVLSVAIGVFSTMHVAALLGIVAPILGVTVAAANTPSGEEPIPVPAKA